MALQTHDTGKKLATSNCSTLPRSWHRSARVWHCNNLLAASSMKPALSLLTHQSRGCDTAGTEAGKSITSGLQNAANATQDAVETIANGEYALQCHRLQGNVMGRAQTPHSLHSMLIAISRMLRYRVLWV